MNNYNSFFQATNEREFPGSAFLIYLCEPVIAVRYKPKKRFESFEDFNNHVEEVKWITELAWTKEADVRKKTIEQAWAFLNGR